MAKLKTFKTYQSIPPHLDLRTFVNVNGVKIPVKFTGCQRYPQPTGGKYMTDNEGVQKALEARDDFGVKFKLIHTVKQEAEAQAPETTPPPAKENPLDNIPQKEDGFKDVYLVKSGQQAKAWFRANMPDIPDTRLRTNASLLEVAKEKKINFPDWQTA